MSVEDKQLCRELSREMGRRRNIDISDTKISVSRCVGYIGGVIRAAPGETLDPKVEAKLILEGCRRVHGLKDVQFDARFETGSKR